MSRWVDREEEKPEGGMDTSLSRSGGGQDKRERVVLAPGEADFGENRRERLTVRGREYWIRPSEREVLFEVGVFRAVDAEDLKRGVYGEKRELAAADLRSLTDQRLMRGLWIRGQQGGARQILALTEQGVALLKSRDPRIERENQTVYAGHVKIAELDHDSLLYRAFLLEKQRLRGEGGSVHRIVLDYELKRELFSRQQYQRGGKPYRELQEQSAKELSLPVVDGHVMLPDFRIEYESEQGERGRVDIEVATGNYRQGHLAAKAQAGFRVYAANLSVESGGHLKGNIFKDRAMTVFAL